MNDKIPGRPARYRTTLSSLDVGDYFFVVPGVAGACRVVAINGDHAAVRTPSGVRVWKPRRHDVWVEAPKGVLSQSGGVFAVERDDEEAHRLGLTDLTDADVALDALTALRDAGSGQTARTEVSARYGCDDPDDLYLAALVTLMRGCVGLSRYSREEAGAKAWDLLTGEAPPAQAPIGLQRDPKNDYDFARLNLAVYAGGGACGDTVRLIFGGLIDCTAEVEWVEDTGDGESLSYRALVVVRQIVQLDDLSPALVCARLHSNGNPRHETRVLRFSSIINVEVG